jgi:DNA helicase-2/ATP-dependent DNA helicase PcrA
MCLMNDYLSELNDSQREAVLYDEGPALVVAGAGSGKTRVLTYKIAHLLQNGYPPHTILALTFTNKAAREMKQRIASVSDRPLTRSLWMGTFHSVFCRILRREAERIGFPADFTIYDSADSKNLIKTIVREMQLDDRIYRPGMIQSRISNAKNALVSCDAYDQNRDLLAYDSLSHVPKTHEIYRRYQRRCFHAGVMDFDELLLQTNILFRDHPRTLAGYRDQFRYVLVDEYQDTNFAQHLIVRRLCEKHGRIFVVGDDAQSIYSFRGANIDNMLRFKDVYPTCRVFKLEQNYRSTQTIVEAANSLIAKNKEQIRKTVFSEKETGGRLSVVSSYSDYEEAYLVSAEILEMMRHKGYSYADFAVLYRTNAQSRVLEEAMRKRMIKYKVYGSQSFYQRKEIKDVIAWFRVIVNPSDEESVRRIIHYPARGIGHTTLDKLQTAAVTSGVSLWYVIASPPEYDVPLHKGTLTKLQDFCLLIEDFRRMSQTTPAVELAEDVIKRSGIGSALFQDTSVEGINRQENVQELLNAMNEFVSIRRDEGSEFASLADFLTEISLLTDQDYEKDEDADLVTLMTVHSAKGLEFKNVFIVGMENDLFPSQRAMNDLRAIEEERRLFYVAITRARENCMITYAKNRYRNGQNHVAAPSFFIKDIDAKYLDFPNEGEWPLQRRGFYSSFSRVRPEGTDDAYGGDVASVRNPAWDAEPSGFGFSAGSRSYGKLSTGVSAKVRRQSVTPSASNVSGYAGTKSAGSGGLADATEKMNLPKGLAVGSKVLHERFGEGEVIGLEDNAKVTVKFKNAGEKKLLLKFAKLVISGQ